MLFVLSISPQILLAETVPTMESAQSDYNAGKFSQAADKYQKMIDSIKLQKKSNSSDQKLVICQYNLARCLDKAGQFDKAKEAYIAVAGSPDDKMALRAKYDLGCLYAQIVNQEAGSDPIQADDSVREKIRSNVNSAVEQWRAVLEVQPDYPDAADKLERVLTVLMDWEAAWKDVDLKKDADKKTALEYIVDVENEILGKKKKSSRLGLKADSLETRQEFFQTAEQLSDTVKKVGLIPDKALKAMSGQETVGEQGQPASPPDLTPEQQAKLEMIKPEIEKLSKDSQAAVEKSAQELRNLNSKAAAASQLEAYQTLDSFYVALSPLYEMIVRSVKEQKDLIKATQKKIKKNQKASKKEAEQDSEKTENQDVSPSADKLAQIELEENVFKQRALLPWTVTIVPKANATLQQLPPEKASQKGDDNSTLKENAENLQDALDALQNPDDAAIDPNSANPQDQQVQKLRNMCKKAVKLGPKIPPLVQSAADDLNASKLESALESQKEALRLLEEIIKDDSQQNQDKQDQQNQDQQNQDKQNKDQQNNDQQCNNKQDQNKDQQNQDKQDQQDQQDQDKQDQDKQDQDKQDKQNDDEQKQDEQNESEQDKKSEEEEQKDQNEQESQQDEQNAQQDEAQQQEGQEQEAQQKEDELTDAQVRGLMRRVQARQEEQKKLEAKLRALLNPPDKVEKDW